MDIFNDVDYYLDFFTKPGELFTTVFMLIIIINFVVMIVTKLAERLLPTSECQGSDPINDFCIIVLQMSVEKRGKGERERERGLNLWHLKESSI